MSDVVAVEFFIVGRVAADHEAARRDDRVAGGTFRVVCRSEAVPQIEVCKLDLLGKVSWRPARGFSPEAAGVVLSRLLVAVASDRELPLVRFTTEELR